MANGGVTTPAETVPGAAGRRGRRVAPLQFPGFQPPLAQPSVPTVGQPSPSGGRGGIGAGIASAGASIAEGLAHKRALQRRQREKEEARQDAKLVQTANAASQQLVDFQNSTTGFQQSAASTLAELASKSSAELATLPQATFEQLDKLRETATRIGAYGSSVIANSQLELTDAILNNDPKAAAAVSRTLANAAHNVQTGEIDTSTLEGASAASTANSVMNMYLAMIDSKRKAGVSAEEELRNIESRKVSEAIKAESNQREFLDMLGMPSEAPDQQGEWLTNLAASAMAVVIRNPEIQAASPQQQLKAIAQEFAQRTGRPMMVSNHVDWLVDLARQGELKSTSSPVIPAANALKKLHEDLSRIAEGSVDVATDTVFYDPIHGDRVVPGLQPETFDKLRRGVGRAARPFFNRLANNMSILHSLLMSSHAAEAELVRVNLVKKMSDIQKRAEDQRRAAGTLSMSDIQSIVADVIANSPEFQNLSDSVNQGLVQRWIADLQDFRQAQPLLPPGAAGPPATRPLQEPLPPLTRPTPGPIPAEGIQ